MNESPVVLWLRRAQADTFCLYAMAHAFHWNVVGPGFPQLHALFEAQYQELWGAVDLLAERVRALQAPAPDLDAMRNLCTLPAGEPPADAEGMVAALLAGHEAASRTVQECFAAAAEADDQATANMMADRQIAHEKAAWMLRSTLGQ